MFYVFSILIKPINYLYKNNYYFSLFRFSKKGFSPTHNNFSLLRLNIKIVD